MDIDWSGLYEWCRSAIVEAEPLMVIVAIELFAVFLTLVVQGLLARRMLLVHHRELVSRTNNDDIETQLINVTDCGTLVISQLPDSTLVSKLFDANTAAQKELKELSRRATYSEPVIPFDNDRRIILEKLFGIVAEHNRNGKQLIKFWLVIPTYWDLPQDRSCIRMQVISEELLRKFLDWDWCKKLKVESRNHWTRIIVMHRAAHYYFGLEQAYEDDQLAQMGRVRRIGRMRLSIRDDDEPLRRFELDWTAPHMREILRQVSLAA